MVAFFGGGEALVLARYLSWRRWCPKSATGMDLSELAVRQAALQTIKYLVTSQAESTGAHIHSLNFVLRASVYIWLIHGVWFNVVFF